MIGAIAGDIIGSVFENNKTWLKNRHVDFHPLFSEQARFTDDTVLTVAVADFLLNNRNLTETLQAYANSYPERGYGKSFKAWILTSQDRPYNSYGNGSAMRVSPVAHAFDSLSEVLHHARESAEVTHNHPEGVKGAKAVAAAIFLAKNGSSRSEIQQYIEGQFNYDLSRSIEQIRPSYKFDATCQGSVPQAITAALESTDFENAVRLAISLGGDTDTLAAIAGSIAEALYGGIPDDIRNATLSLLDDHLLGILYEFQAQYCESTNNQ